MFSPQARFTIARLPLSSLVVTEHQVRYPERVLHYVQLLIAHPTHDPGFVIVTRYGKPRQRLFTLLDGHHRYCAAILAGRSDLLCILVEDDENLTSDISLPGKIDRCTLTPETIVCAPSGAGWPRTAQREAPGSPGARTFGGSRMSRIKALFLPLFLALFLAVALPVAAANEGYIAGYDYHDVNSHMPDYSDAGQAEAFQYGGLQNGNVTTLHIYLASNTTADEVLLGVYSESSSKPASLLGECMVTTITKGGWNTCDIPSGGITVSTMSGYWLAVMAPHGHGTPQYYDTYASSSSAPSYSTAATTLTDLPASFGTTTQNWGNGPAEFYGGTPPSGGA